MRGVVVDFYTLYDPVALTGAILTYVPVYGKIYMPKQSLWLEANSYGGHGWVPISGFKLLEDGLDFLGIEWLRNWVRKSLNVSEDRVVKENLYASIMLIYRSMEMGIVEVLPNDEEFIRIGEEILKDEGLSSGILWDSMMSFGEERNENGFYLSPDLGHGFPLGVGLVLGGKDDFRFSTNNPEIKKGFEILFSAEHLGKKLEIIQDREFGVEIQCGPSLGIEDVFESLKQGRSDLELSQFLGQIEQLKKDLIYFMPEVSLDLIGGKLRVGLGCRAYAFLEHKE